MLALPGLRELTNFFGGSPSTRNRADFELGYLAVMRGTISPQIVEHRGFKRHPEWSRQKRSLAQNSKNMATDELLRGNRRRWVHKSRSKVYRISSFRERKKVGTGGRAIASAPCDQPTLGAIYIARTAPSRTISPFPSSSIRRACAATGSMGKP
jgi:hypothetical protein